VVRPVNGETGSWQGSGFEKIDLADDSRSTLTQTRQGRNASPDLAAYVEHFRTRVLQDALTEALRSTWLRRADAFEAAKHKPGDYLGRRTMEQVHADNRRLGEKAEACRRHASICIFQDDELLCEHLAVAA
jgi:hypothetical protein